MAKQATQIQKSFDPKKISLRDLVELYIKESAFKNDSATANKIRQTFNRDFLDGNTKKIKNQLNNLIHLLHYHLPHRLILLKNICFLFVWPLKMHLMLLYVIPGTLIYL